MATVIVPLSDDDICASGTQRIVYRHPEDPARLIKVQRPTPLSDGRSALAVWTERHIPFLRNRWIGKEHAEYARLIERHNSSTLHAPIIHLYGYVRTTRGQGTLTDAVLEGDQLGPTLRSKVKNGTLADEDLALFNDCIARLYEYDIRASDMTYRNFVFGHRTVGGQPGPRECVLVDGFGDIHAIPVRSLGRVFNQIGLDDSCQRLARRAGLSWDKTTKEFAMKAKG